MKTIRLLSLMAALAAGSTAYADKAPAKAAVADKAPAADPKKVTDADAQRFVAFFDKLVDICVANKADCPKMAAGINAHIDANQALLKQVAEYKQAGKELPAAMKERLEKKTKEELVPAMNKCGADQGVQAALTRMKPPASSK